MSRPWPTNGRRRKVENSTVFWIESETAIPNTKYEPCFISYKCLFWTLIALFNFVSLQICISDRTFLFLDFTITPPAELPKLVFCNFHDILLLFISFYLINKNWTQSKDSLVKMKMLFSEILNKSTKVFLCLGPICLSSSNFISWTVNKIVRVWTNECTYVRMYARR